MQTYDKHGLANFDSEMEAFHGAAARVAGHAGALMSDGRTVEEALALVGWRADARPNAAAAAAIEWSALGKYPSEL